MFFCENSYICSGFWRARTVKGLYGFLIIDKREWLCVCMCVFFFGLLCTDEDEMSARRKPRMAVYSIHYWSLSMLGKPLLQWSNVQKQTLITNTKDKYVRTYQIHVESNNKVKEARQQQLSIKEKETKASLLYFLVLCQVIFASMRLMQVIIREKNMMNPLIIH